MTSALSEPATPSEEIDAVRDAESSVSHVGAERRLDGVQLEAEVDGQRAAGRLGDRDRGVDLERGVAEGHRGAAGDTDREVARRALGQVEGPERVPSSSHSGIEVGAGAAEGRL